MSLTEIKARHAESVKDRRFDGPRESKMMAMLHFPYPGGTISEEGEGPLTLASQGAIRVSSSSG